MYLLIDQEVLLLWPGGGEHALGARSEQLQDANRLLRQGFHRTEQRRLLVERLAGPADEGSGDHQGGAVRRDEQPGRAGRIPCGVAAGFEGGAHSARWETRRIRLTLDQFLA